MRFRVEDMRDLVEPNARWPEYTTDIGDGRHCLREKDLFLLASAVFFV